MCEPSQVSSAGAGRFFQGHNSDRIAAWHRLASLLYFMPKSGHGLEGCVGRKGTLEISEFPFKEKAESAPPPDPAFQFC